MPHRPHIKTRTSVMVLMLLTGLLSYLASVHVYHHAPVTTDENSYLFQAVNFSEGRIAREAPPFPKAFAHRMIIQHPEAGWLSRYPPLHALWLLPGIWLGDPYLMSALAAMLSILLLAAVARHSLGSTWAWTAPLLLAISPYFIFMHGTLLSHTSGVTAAAMLLWGYWRWRETGRWQDALIAGLGWGLICLNRTYTALCLCPPLALDALWLLWRERTPRRLVGLLSFAASAAAGVGALLLYNGLAVGDPMTMTYLFYDPSEALGFGPRHTSGIPIDHSFINGLRYLRDNLVSLDRWVLGVPFGLVLTVTLVVLGWQRRTSLLLMGCVVSVWAGYVYFWYPGINESGPVYYMETMPFLALAAAQGLVRLVQWSCVGGVLRRCAVCVGGILILASGTHFALREGRALSSETYAERAELRRVIDAAPSRSLVFVPRQDHSDYLVLNTHGLQSDPLALSSVRGQNMAIVRYFADRQIFRLEYRPRARLVPHEEGALLDFSLSGTAFHRHTGVNIEHDGVPVRAAFAGQHEAGMLAFGQYIQPYPGRFAGDFGIQAHGGASNAVAATVMMVKDAGQTVVFEANVYSGQAIAIPCELDIDNFDALELRVYYTGEADVILSRVTMRDVLLRQ